VRLCAAILAVFRPLWIFRVRRKKVFAHFGFAECAAKKKSSIVDFQSTSQESFRPLRIFRVRRKKVFAHCGFSECAAAEFSSIAESFSPLQLCKVRRENFTVHLDREKVQLDLFASVAEIHRHKLLINRCCDVYPLWSPGCIKRTQPGRQFGIPGGRRNPWEAQRINRQIAMTEEDRQRKG
jgi:hypothetical protein